MEEENKTKNKFIVKYVIFIIILILITMLGIYFSIGYIDKTMEQSETVENSEIDSEDEMEETKKVAEDSKYAINSYSETYDTNALEIKYYYDIDGKITKENQYSDYETNIAFIQIEGLKNKEIQDKINAKLKNTVYTLEKNKSVYTSVMANFSNVLSVMIHNDIVDDEAKTLNFDLTTGEEIPFEKLFVSSAPIKSMLAESKYKNFAWDKLYEDYEGYDGVYDMKNADTSEIEDDILMYVSQYDKIKDKIIYNFTESSISICNKEFKGSIDMLDYINEIAIYKRYLTKESIFEDDNLSEKGLIVLTQELSDEKSQISYGKIADNIFVEDVLWHGYELEEGDISTVLKYVQNLAQEKQKMLKQETANSKGVISQTEYYVNKHKEDSYYWISVSDTKAECSLSYFKEKAFKDYIVMKKREDADAALNMFGSWDWNDSAEMQSVKYESKTYYLSMTGEFLGNTEEEAKSKIWE